jgi:hypothetical protein
MRRDEPLLPSDDDEVMAVMLSVAAGAEYLAYAGTRGNELYCRVFCFDAAEKARAMQAWIDASGASAIDDPACAIIQSASHCPPVLPGSSW